MKKFGRFLYSNLHSKFYITHVMAYIATLLLILIFSGSAFAQQVEITPIMPQYQAPASQTQSLQGETNLQQIPLPSPQQLPSPQSVPQISNQQAMPTQQPLQFQEPTSQQQQSQTAKPVQPEQPAQLYNQASTQPKPSTQEPSYFEEYIKGTLPSTISTNLKQFGYNLFSNPPSTFAPANNVPVGPDYVIGPGDEVKISVWGTIEGQWSVVVDRNGNISLPTVGVIGVAGLTFKELKELLHKEFSKYYTGFHMNVTMGSLRTIQVYVVGYAKNPGSYTVSSLSTLINALFAAGGPSKNGTMRDIEVKRNGETIDHFDMYDFLLKGDKTNDIRLMPQDVIFIPPVGPLVAIAGEVKNPAIYELKGETKLLDLIQMAGGLNAIAFNGRAQIQRTINHEYRTIFEGSLANISKDSKNNITLENGDLVKIFPVVEANNTIIISGAVANPGVYAIKPGLTTVKEVISRAGGLLYYAYDKAEITRVTVTQAGPETERIPIDISKAMKDDPKDNIPLETNDYLSVRTVPEWQLYRLVSIYGEVKFPGVYPITKGERLSSLIAMAGGYTDRAYLRGAVFIRESVKKLQQESLQDMTLRLERELLEEGSVQASTASSAEDIQAQKVEMANEKSFIESLKYLKATGRMVVYLAPVRLLKGSEYDIALENGDSLYIPPKNDVVNVVGDVMSPCTLVYSNKLNYKDYIRMAGGFTRYADKDDVYVLKADGSAQKLSSGFVNWNPFKSRWEIAGFEEKTNEIEPGDTIVVPEKLTRVPWLREIKDITQILMQMAVTAGVVIHLY